MDIVRLLTPSAEVVPPESVATVRRRRRVVVATLVTGTALLAATLAVPAGSARFTVLGLLVAATWIAGSLLSGPLHLGRRGGDPGASREIAAPIGLGVVAYLVFLVASLVAREIPGLGGALDTILDKADAGSLALVLVIALVNGAAEEVFFRGALHSALGDRDPILWSTVVYVLVTVATRNLALVLAAAVMGTVFALERRSTHGILAPTLTHLTWTTLMLLALPR